MGKFLIDPEGLRNHAMTLGDYSEAAQTGFNALQARLADIEGYFSGKASTAFQGHMEEWHASGRALTLALAGLGEFLISEADEAERMDEALAG